MKDDRPVRTHPGHWMLWLTAWSLQGVALLVADTFAIDPEPVHWVVTGLLAAVPLAGLYLFLVARGRAG